MCSLLKLVVIQYLSNLTHFIMGIYITDAKKNIRAFAENAAQNAITSRITSSLQSAFGI